MTTLDEAPTALTHIAGHRLTGDRTAAHELNDRYSAHTAQLGPLDFPTMVLPPVPHDDDPLDKIAPGTRAATEAQQIDESQAPYWHQQRRESGAVGGAVSNFGLVFVALFAIWLFHGMPDLVSKWADILLLVPIAGACLLPLLVGKHIRSKEKR